MKSTRKHELQTNEWADALGRFIEVAQPHARTIGYIVGAVVVGVLVVTILLSRPGAAVGLSAEVFFSAQQRGDTQALRDFLKDYPQAAEVPAAKVLLADRIVSDVVRGTGDAAGPEGRAKAPGLLAEAKELNEQAGKASTVLEPLAQVGLALITVQQGDVAKGVEVLNEVVKKWPQSIAADKARAHVEELAAYKPLKFSDEPLEEEKNLEPKAGGTPEGGGKESPAPKAEAKPPEAKPAETPKAPAAKPADAPKAPAGEKAPAPAPKG
jgi:hypothetical protein